MSLDQRTINQAQKTLYSMLDGGARTEIKTYRAGENVGNVSVSHLQDNDLVVDQNGVMFLIYDRTRKSGSTMLSPLVIGEAVDDLELLLQFPGDVQEAQIIEKVHSEAVLRDKMMLYVKPNVELYSPLTHVSSQTLSVGLDQKGEEHYFYSVGSVHLEIQEPVGHRLTRLVDEKTYSVLRREKNTTFATQASQIPQAEVATMWRDDARLRSGGVFVVVNEEKDGKIEKAVEYLDENKNLRPFHVGIKNALTQVNDRRIDMTQIYGSILQSYPHTHLGDLMQAPQTTPRVPVQVSEYVLTRELPPPQTTILAPPRAVAAAPQPPVIVSPVPAVNRRASTPLYDRIANWADNHSYGLKAAGLGVAVLGLVTAGTLFVAKSIIEYQARHPSAPAVVSAQPSAPLYASSTPAITPPAPTSYAVPATTVIAPVSYAPVTSAPATRAVTREEVTIQNAPSLAKGNSRFFVDAYIKTRDPQHNTQQMVDLLGVYCGDAFGKGNEQLINKDYSIEQLFGDMVQEFKPSDTQAPDYNSVLAQFRSINWKGTLKCN